MRTTDRNSAPYLLDGVGDKLLYLYVRIGDTVDERRVGAVLQQSADEIGEKRLVRADRRIDPARTVELVRADHLLIQRFPHAVQALDLVLAWAEAVVGQRVHRRQRM